MTIFTDLDLMKDQPEKITTAAIKAQDGTIYTKDRPARHTQIVYLMVDRGLGIKDTAYNQGFLTSWGRFVDRKEAKAIAISQEQVLDFNRLHDTDLFTEDLW